MLIKYPRQLINQIKVAMNDTPVVMINGPRQAGKTTLAKQFMPEMSYYTLDDENILQAARHDPVGFIRQVETGIIDEIQHAPELLRSIKLAVDEDRKPGKFLLTGSANLLAIPKVSDSLAGRMEILTLLPLSQSEIYQTKSQFLDLALMQNWPLMSSGAKNFDYISTAVTGGYPEMLARTDSSRRTAWAKSYIKAIVERDVKDISNIEKLLEMPHLLDVLAEHSGQLINFTKIGGQLKLDTKTTQKYVTLLESLFLVSMLQPWHRNTLSRIVKTPKIHFIDSGLLACLRKITPEKISKDKSLSGALLETWVFSELRKIINIHANDWGLFHYRDKDKVEVDFVLETEEKKIIGVEVKASYTVIKSDFNGLIKLSSLATKQWITGIVLYAGDKCLSFGDSLWAIPFSMLF